MSSIGTGLASADARIIRLAARTANIANAEANAIAAAENGRTARLARGQISSRDGAPTLTARDARFDPPAPNTAHDAPDIEIVRRIAHQIAARLAYHTSITVVRTMDQTIRASIDVSA